MRPEHFALCDGGGGRGGGGGGGGSKLSIGIFVFIEKARLLWTTLGQFWTTLGRIYWSTLGFVSIYQGKPHNFIFFFLRFEWVSKLPMRFV